MTVKNRLEVLNAFDVILATLGIGGAPFTGGGSALAAGALVGGKKLVQGAPFKTTAAISLNEMKKLEPILKQLSPAARAGVLRAFARIAGRRKTTEESEE